MSQARQWLLTQIGVEHPLPFSFQPCVIFLPGQANRLSENMLYVASTTRLQMKLTGDVEM